MLSLNSVVFTSPMFRAAVQRRMWSAAAGRGRANITASGRGYAHTPFSRNAGIPLEIRNTVNPISRIIPEQKQGNLGEKQTLFSPIRAEKVSVCFWKDYHGDDSKNNKNIFLNTTKTSFAAGSGGAVVYTCLTARRPWFKTQLGPTHGEFACSPGAHVGWAAPSPHTVRYRLQHPQFGTGTDALLEPHVLPSATFNPKRAIRSRLKPNESHKVPPPC